MGSRGARTRTGPLAAMVLLSALLVPAAPAGAQTTTSSSSSPTTSTTSTSSTTSTTSSTTSVPTTTTTTATPEPQAALVAPTAAGITVTPSAGLGYRQSVTITGAGFMPDAGVGYSQCAAHAAGPADCFGSGAVWTDADGAFTTSFTVRRFLTTANGEVDCASAPGACIIGAALLDGYTQGTSTPLAFDPSAPIPPPPTIFAFPSHDLGLEAEVRVSGLYFGPDDYALFRLCLRSRTDAPACGTSIVGFARTDGTGAVSTTVLVHRGIRLPDGAVVDCAVAPGCSLVGWSGSDPERPGSTPLHFDPSVPVPPPPMVVVTPSVGLADRQLVTASVTGLMPDTFVLVGQCRGGQVGLEACTSLRPGTASPEGTLEVVVQVRRILRTGFESTDCAAAAGSCAVAVIQDDYPFAFASVPLTFDPTAPPVPLPTFSAAPTTGLVDGSVITVTGSGFAPHEQVAVIQCINDPRQDDSGRGCDLSGTLRYLSADDAGDLTATVTLRRTLTTQGYGTVDCATVPQGCILGWAGVNDIQTQRGNVVLSFVAGEPGAPGGGSGAPDGQQLAFTGSSSGRLAGLGLGALVVGLALVAATRARRRRAPSPG